MLCNVILPLARGEGALPGAPRGRREVLFTSVGNPTPDHVVIRPGNTALSLGFSATIGVFMLPMLVSLYWVWVCAKVIAGILQPVDIAPGQSLPVQHGANSSVAQTQLGAFLVANGTLFA